MTQQEYRAVLADAGAMTPGELSQAAYVASISRHITPAQSAALASLAAESYAASIAPVPVAA
jgi:hypothetical protein